MVSDGTRTIAAIIAVAIALAATCPFLATARPEAMSLEARDVGSGWLEIFRSSFDFPPNYYVMVVLSNQTCIVIGQIFVYEPHKAIDVLSHNGSVIFSFAEEVDIGYGGYIESIGSNSFMGVSTDGRNFSFSSSTGVRLEFVKENVRSIITLCVEGDYISTQSWMKELVLDLGNAQLPKIERYLGH